MTAYPLMLTVELEESCWSDDHDSWGPEYGSVVIKINGHVIRKFELRSHVYPGDRETLEQYAADWLASLGKEDAT
jgi:hypothetical protein